MIYPTPKKWADYIFIRYLRYLFKSDFSAIYSLKTIPEIPNNNACIITPNHSSWYDGFIVYWINKIYWKKKFRVLMLSEQLKKYYFFKNIGACGFAPTEPQDVLKFIRYSTNLIIPENIFVFFPQGKIIPETGNSYELKLGLKLIKSNYPTEILPIHFRIVHLNERKPVLFILPGQFIPFAEYLKDPTQLTLAMNSLQAETSQMLHQSNYGNLLAGKPINPH